MRFRLRTLLIVLATLPVVLAAPWLLVHSVVGPVAVPCAAYVLLVLVVDRRP
jgi:hypothetical protein